MARYSTSAAAESNLTGVAIRPSGRTRTATSRMVDLNDRLARVLGDADAIGDRLLGSVPTPQQTDKVQPQPVPNGSLEELHEQISRAEGLLASLSAAVDRLNEAD
ncbi:MAG: hypothetical protein RJA36_2417 [Pseudomonadota bacterium]